MNKMKRIALIVATVVLMAVCFVFGASAEEFTDGIYTYTVNDGKAILTDLDSNASGDVVLPSTLGGYPLVEIGGWSITYCNEITSLTIPEGVTTLGDHAIYNCNKISNISFPSTLRKLDEASLKDLDSLTELVLPEGLEYIGSDLITYNMRIDSITIPSTVKNIDFIAFNTCLNVEDVYIYSKDVEIKDYAFGYSEMMPVDGYTAKDVALAIQKCLDETDETKKAELKEEYEKMFVYADDFVGQNMTIHGYYGTTAYDYAWKNNIKFECMHSVDNWETDNYIYRYGDCSYCDNRLYDYYETFTEGYYTYTVVDNEAAIVGVSPELEGDVVLPSTIGGYPLVAVDGAFYRNETVTSVVIPDGVRYVGRGTFEKCKTKLKKVVMTDSVTYLGAGAFMECYNLEEVVLSNNIKVFDFYAFELCYSLKKLNIPNNLEIVGCLSMSGCASIEELVFPESVKEIQGYTLLNFALSLKKIVIPKNAKSIDDHNGGFSEMASLEDVYVYSPDYDFTGSELGYVSIGPKDISKEEWIAMYVEAVRSASNHQEMNELFDVFLGYTEMFGPRVSDILTIHAVHDSKAEIYAKDNGIRFEYIHDFTGSEWVYDYENNVRTRKCIYCDELQVEKLEIEEVSGEEFILVEEIVTNGIEADVEVLKVFDINLKNGDGFHVQPDGTIKVKLPNDWTKQGVYKVYRVNDDGTLTDMNAYREGSHLVFDTTHFSIYVIVVEGEGVSDSDPETPEIPDEPETPAEPDTSDCYCICHMKGFVYEILAIVFRFVANILEVFPTCDCGIAHY